MGKLGVFGLLALLLSVGCQGGETTTDDEQAGVVACDPLATEHVSLELGRVLGAGKSADGTLYVIDHFGDSDRVFVSDGAELVLRNASGTGQVTEADGTLLSFWLEGTPELHVQLWQGNDGTTRLGVLEGELPKGAKEFEIGAQGEELELVPPSDVADVKLRQDNIDTVVEYAASVAGERLLVVLRPEKLDSYEQFRVFFGALGHLQERSPSNVSRALDGGSTWINFDVDGQTAEATFPVVFENDVFARGTPTFTLGKSDVAIDLLPEGQAPDGAAYYCAK